MGIHGNFNSRKQGDENENGMGGKNYVCDAQYAILLPSSRCSLVETSSTMSYLIIVKIVVTNVGLSPVWAMPRSVVSSMSPLSETVVFMNSSTCIERENLYTGCILTT